MLSCIAVSNENRENPRFREGFKVYEGDNPEAIKKIMTKYLWSPIIWKYGARTESNFECAQYAALDFENPDVSIKEIERTFCDSWHIIGTTRNHQKAKGEQGPIDRFRLLLRFEHIITDIHQYKFNIKFLARRFGADENCTDAARLFFPCTEIVAELCGEDLFSMEIREDIGREDRLQRIKEQAEFHNSYGRMSTYARTWLLNPIPFGRQRVTFFLLGKELCRQGIEYEQAVSSVLASPTCAGKTLDTNLKKVVRRQVRDGFKAVHKDLF